ncbi:cell division protein SepF [Eggerthellaceae bacterium 3-80]|nr:cell division protein SepF [bacterium D16-34]
MFDGLKSKLGFAEAEGEVVGDQYFDDASDDYGEGYDEFEEYGPSYQADDGYRDRSSVRESYDRYANPSIRPAHAASRRESSSPRLVSIEDVRARTQIPESLKRDPLPPRHVSSASSSRYQSERTMVDPATSAHAGTPNARAQASSALTPSSAASSASAQERSESLNSLFSPTTDSAASTSRASDGRAYDPYDAYSGSVTGKHTPTRSLTVIKPASYAEAERVAKALKAGDVVVLALRNTPDTLAKRILDFSFGASSALDASVECIADKVFAISRGAALSQAELTMLKNQGVL